LSDKKKMSELEKSTLNKTEKEDIEKLSEKIDIEDSQSILEFGLGAQTELSDFASSVLAQMRSTKTGDIEYPLERLLMNVQSVDIGDIMTDTKHSYKKYIKKARKVLLGYQKIDRQIYSIEVQLESARNQLLRDIVLLDKMKEKNEEHKKNLEIHIIAGDMYLNKNSRNISGNPIDGRTAKITRLEKRIHNLKLSRMISLQMTPQIELVQNTNKTLMEKIQTSLLSTIPLWRNQMVIAQALMKQKSALRMQEEFVDRANDILEENADKLKEKTVQIEMGTEAGILDIAKLKDTSKMLIKAIQECQNAIKLGETEIGKAEKEIMNIKKEISTE